MNREHDALLELRKVAQKALLAEARKLTVPETHTRVDISCVKNPSPDAP